MSSTSPGYIIALTGPSGIGKTTISQLLIAAVSDYTEKPPIVTTRVPKEHDGDEYCYVSAEQFRKLKETGALAAQTKLPPPRERRWYGYRTDDLEAVRQKGKIPVVITEIHLLEGLVAYYGRRLIFSCGLLPPGKNRHDMYSVLLHRLRARGRDSEESIQGRIENAEHDLAFFTERRDLFDCLFVNESVDSIVSVLEARVLRLALDGVASPYRT
uniref:Guanylate kinase n=1 Tax=Candidatus Kentrum eta TaxID=2126337 RepID=A0A450VJD6_9GAMM|nr:MAG: Guanylate kinase [Candidatus Kentron sp. H]VFK01038.1 MAG: Guanylate kinase [Candidatus Kentron sp. H]VFK04919.1 MAG: Guanylate kinase [Candidatus Kentron sp. H]